MAEVSEHPSITCPVCAMTSYHPKDIEHGYCGNCHDYTANPDGCVRAYIKVRTGDDNVDPWRIFQLVHRWFQVRGPGDRIIDWLPAHYTEAG
jgi:hypothetical protein